MQVIILDVQFQMACITMFTLATLYSVAGGPVAKYLDDYRESIKEQVTEVDKETLLELTETIEANKKLLQLEEDAKALHSLSDDLAVAQADVLNHINQHRYRDAILKKLDALVAIEDTAVNALRTRMMKSVNEDVLKAFTNDKKAKDAALAQAIAVLSAGPGATMGKDVVGEQFASALKKYRADYAKMPKESDEILVQLERDLAAVANAPAVETVSDVATETFLLGNVIKA